MRENPSNRNLIGEYARISARAESRDITRRNRSSVGANASRWTGRPPLAYVLVLLLGCSVGAALADDDASSARVKMTPAVVCETITGYKDYVELEEPSRARDEKLLLYYEPTEYAYKKVGNVYQAHLTQDVKLRKHGDKKVIWQKNDILKYEPKSKSPPGFIYLSNTIALKPYEPGEYDLEIILHDQIGKGPVATQVVRFTIKPAPAPAPAPKPTGTPKGDSKDRKPTPDSP